MRKFFKKYIDLIIVFSLLLSIATIVEVNRNYGEPIELNGVELLWPFMF